MCLVASYLSKVSNSKYPANCTLLEMIWYHQPVWPSLKIYEAVPWGEACESGFPHSKGGGQEDERLHSWGKNTSIGTSIHHPPSLLVATPFNASVFHHQRAARPWLPTASWVPGCTGVAVLALAMGDWKAKFPGDAATPHTPFVLLGTRFPSFPLSLLVAPVLS